MSSYESSSCCWCGGGVGGIRGGGGGGGGGGGVETSPMLPNITGCSEEDNREFCSDTMSPTLSSCLTNNRRRCAAASRIGRMSFVSVILSCVAESSSLGGGCSGGGGVCGGGGEMLF